MGIGLALFFILIGLGSFLFVWLLTKRKPRQEAYRYDPFWKNFTGLDTLEMLNRGLYPTAKKRECFADIFINEEGIFFSHRVFAAEDFVARYNTSQNPNVKCKIVDLLDYRVESDWVNFRFSKAGWGPRNEITFQINPHEAARIKFFIEKGNWKKPFILRKTKSRYHRDPFPFWKNFTGLETLEILNRESVCKGSFVRRNSWPLPISFYMNELGIFFASPYGTDFIIRLNPTFKFEVNYKVVDLTDCRIERDRASFQLSPQGFIVPVEFTLTNISAEESEKMKFFLEKANWIKMCNTVK